MKAGGTNLLSRYAPDGTTVRADRQAGLGSIGVDANVMLAASVRRFLCAMQEDTDGEVVVVPQAWNETWWRCTDTGLKAARNEVYRSGKWRDADETRKREAVITIAEANEQGFRRWLEAERTRNDAAWKTVGEDPRAGRLHIELLDTPIFSDNANRHRDAMVVAQCLLAGTNVVTSENFKTIDHDLLNRWTEEGIGQGRPEFENASIPFVLRVDEAVRRRLEEVRTVKLASCTKRWAIGVWRPENAEERHPEELRQGLLRFTDQLVAGGMRSEGKALNRRIREAHGKELKDYIVGIDLGVGNTGRAEHRRLAM